MDRELHTRFKRSIVNLDNLSFGEKALVNVIITHAKFALQVVGEWAENNVEKQPDEQRDKDVIEAIRFIDKAAEELLKIGVKPEDVNKLLSGSKGKRFNLK